MLLKFNILMCLNKVIHLLIIVIVGIDVLSQALAKRDTERALSTDSLLLR